MDKLRQQFESVLALLARCGITSETGVKFDVGEYGADVYLFAESMTPERREALIAERGPPTRPEARASDPQAPTRAIWEGNPRIVAYEWPWGTCGSCGQTVPTGDPVHP